MPERTKPAAICRACKGSGIDEKHLAKTGGEKHGDALPCPACLGGGEKLKRPARRPKKVTHA